MFDVHLRKMTDSGEKGAILPVAQLDITQVDSATATLSFVVSEKVAGRMDAPQVVALEYSTGGAFKQPRNGLFMASVDDSDDSDAAGTVRFKATLYTTWLLQRTYLHWAAGAANGERMWTETGHPASAGTIMGGMFLESKARGWGAPLSIDFTWDKDSAGVPWTADEKVLQPWRLLTPLTGILQSITDQGLCDWWTEGTLLRLFRPGTGEVRENLVFGGPLFDSRPTKSSFDDVLTHLTVVPEKAANWLYLTNAGASNRFGRLEGTITQSGVADHATATTLAQSALAGSKAIKREYSFDWTPGRDTPNPWADFNLGDVVTSKTRHGKTLQRVIGIQVRKTGQAVTARAIVGDKLLTQAAKQTRRTAAATIGGTIGGGGAAFPVTDTKFPVPTAPTALRVASNVGSWRPDGTAQATVQLAWDAVSQAVDGSAVDVEAYEVAARTGVSDAAILIATEGLTFTTDAWAPGTEQRVKVRAISAAGGPSAWSAEVTVVPATPASIIPKAPTGLAAPSNVGAYQSDGSALSTVTVTWNAVTASLDNAPVDIAEYEVKVGLDTQRVTAATATFTLPAGRAAAVTVRALTTLGVWGDPSAVLNVTGEVPAALLAAPAKPVLTTAQGIVFAAWGGSLTTGAPGAGFQHVVAELALAAAGPWTRAGSPIPRGGGGVSIKGTAGEKVWVRFTGIDTLGRPGTVSASETITVKAVEVGDIDKAITDAIAKAQGDATAAAGTAGQAVTNAAAAQTRADAAKAAADAAQANADALLARGTDLITNGNASQGLRNFSLWQLELGDQPPGTAGAFWGGTAAQGTRTLDEFIPVDPSKPLLASMWVRQVNAGVVSRCYFGLVPFDIDELAVSPYNYMEQAGTRTTLAAPLSAGQTTVQLTSAAGWHNGATDHMRSIIFWNYVDSKGKAWAPGTYSRNSRLTAWAQGGITGNTITLSAPWTGATVPAGTPVGNTQSGGNYMYAPGIANALVTNEWQQLVATVPFGGIHTDITAAAGTAYPAGTAKVKVVLLCNYGVTGGTSKQRFAGLSLSESTAAQLRAAEARAAAATAQAAAVAAQTAAGTAQTTANAAVTSASGRNAMYHATTAPAGAGTREGDIWHQWSTMAVNGKLLNTWRYTGTVWVKTALDEAYIPQLNIGAGTYGSLVGDRLAANSVGAEKLLVGDFQNYFNDPTFSHPAGYAPWTAVSGGIEKNGTGAQAGSYGAHTDFTVTPGERYRFTATRENLAGAAGDVILAVQRYGPAGGFINAVIPLTMSAAGTYSAEYVIPQDATRRLRVGFYTQANMPAATKVRISDVSIRRMVAGELIVDGTLKARHIDAVEFFANQAVIDQATVNILKAGVIQVDMLAPNVGPNLDITANGAVNIIVGRQNAQADQLGGLATDVAGAQGSADEAAAAAAAAGQAASTAQATAGGAAAAASDAATRVARQEMYVRIDTAGMALGDPATNAELRLAPDGIRMMQNGVAASTWIGGVLISDEVQLRSARIANHQWMPYGSGLSVLRPLQ